jgi:hypothetical protein
MWIKDLNVTLQTVKLQQERIEKTLEHIGIGNEFLNRTSVAQNLRERTDKWDCIKLKSFYTAKETVNILKRLFIEWGKIFASCISDKGLIGRIYKELKNPINKWASEFNRQFSKQEVQMAHAYMKKCLTFLAIQEMQIKTTLRFHFTPVRIAIIKNTNNNKCWQRCRENCLLLVGMQISTTNMESSMEIP